MGLYGYSAKNNAFFQLSEIENYQHWDLKDLIKVGDDVFMEFTRDRTADGFLRVAGENGLPVWSDIPPRTAEEMEVDAAYKKTALIAYATQVIAPLKDALDGGYIDDEDKPKLTSWQKYRYSLTKVDTSNPQWPEMPE